MRAVARLVLGYHRCVCVCVGVRGHRRYSDTHARSSQSNNAHISSPTGNSPPPPHCPLSVTPPAKQTTLQCLMPCPSVSWVERWFLPRSERERQASPTTPAPATPAPPQLRRSAEHRRRKKLRVYRLPPLSLSPSLTLHVEPGGKLRAQALSRRRLPRGVPCLKLKRGWRGRGRALCGRGGRASKRTCLGSRTWIDIDFRTVACG